MNKYNKNKFILIYKDLNKNNERILAKGLRTYEEAERHRQYYNHLGYPIETLEIIPLIE